MGRLEVYLQKRVAKYRSENLNDSEIYERLKAVTDSRKKLWLMIQAAR